MSFFSKIFQHLIVFVLLGLPGLSQAQKIRKPQHFQIHLNPGLGFMHLSEPLDYHQALARKLDKLPQADPNGTYLPAYTQQPIRRFSGSSQLPFQQIGFSLGWEQAKSEQKAFHSRFDLGLYYQMHPGRRSEYRQLLPAMQQLTADTSFPSAILIFEEMLDLLELGAKYQVRLNAADSKHALYLGMATRLGTELFFRQINFKRTGVEYDATAVEMNSPQSSELLTSRRGLYLSFLVPFTYEWQFSPKWAFNTNLNMGWGLVNYGRFFRNQTEKFQAMYLDFGLRYTL